MCWQNKITYIPLYQQQVIEYACIKRSTDFRLEYCLLYLLSSTDSTYSSQWVNSLKISLNAYVCHKMEKIRFTAVELMLTGIVAAGKQNGTRSDICFCDFSRKWERLWAHQNLDKYLLPSWKPGIWKKSLERLALRKRGKGRLDLPAFFTAGYYQQHGAQQGEFLPFCTIGMPNYFLHHLFLIMPTKVVCTILLWKCLVILSEKFLSHSQFCFLISTRVHNIYIINFQKTYNQTSHCTESYHACNNTM